MTTIHEAYINALLADATYALAVSGPYGGSNLKDALNNRMTSTLANFIGNNFEVIENINTSDDPLEGSGFDATVWRGTAGEYAGKTYVTFRGSEDTADFVSADLDLTLSGVAKSQIIDMVNWWLKNTTASGQQALQIKSNTGSYELASSVPGTGVITDVSNVIVNGHSLGGHLAAAFSRLFGNQINIEHVYTYNSAGFTGNSENIFSQIESLLGPGISTGSFQTSIQTNFYAENGVNATTRNFENIQIGFRQGLFNEEDPLLTTFANHFMYKLTDSLALADTISKLDSTFDITKMSAMFDRGSNLKAASLESVLDSFRKLLIGNSVITTLIGDVDESAPSRLQFYQNLTNLQNSASFQSLIGKVTVASPTSAGEARSDLGLFLSLYYLLPFALKTDGSLTADQKLSASNPDISTQFKEDLLLSSEQLVNGEAYFSNNWIADRAAMLSWVNKRNFEDANVNKIFDGPDFLYWDEATDTEIQVGSFFVGGLDRRQIKFGDENSNFIEGGNINDRLYGMGGNDAISGGSGNDLLDGGAGQDTLNGGSGGDILLGGAGEDALNGGTGNDRLMGGAGIDAYHFSDIYGIDIVNDTDGQGSIYVNLSSASGGVYKLDNIYKNEGNGFTYTKVNGGNTLIISKEGDSNRIIIDNWSESKNLGITLDDQISATPSGNVINGDIKKKVSDRGTEDPSDDIYYYSGSNYISDGQEVDAKDVINGTSGNDVIYGFGGEDALSGGAGDDYLYGGDGGDLLQGGEGVDHIFGGEGDDLIYAGSAVQLNPTSLNLPTQTPPYLGPYTVDAQGFNWLATHPEGWVLPNGAVKNGYLSIAPGSNWLGNLQLMSDGSSNYIDGGAGRDHIVGSAGAEYVIAGSGNDTVFAYGGNDIVFGGEGNDYLVGDGDDEYFPELFGDDILDGGDGNDMLIGSGGDDILYGGDGNDQLWGDSSIGVPVNTGNNFLYGGKGEDQLVGGEGNDYLDGGDDDDTLYGGLGDDILIGGAGADKFIGGGGADTIYLNIKEGDQILGQRESIDVIIYDAKASEIQEMIAEVDNAGAPTGNIKIGVGGSSANRSSNSSITNTDDLLSIGTNLVSDKDYYHSFADGDILNSDLLGNNLNTELTLASEALAIFGGKLNDDLSAIGNGNVTLFGGQGNDILRGNTGNNTFQGGQGDDTYVVNSGGGVDRIIDNAGESNVLAFGVGISNDQIKLKLGSFLIDLGNGDEIHIDNFDQDDVLHSSSIKSFMFANGAVISLADFVARGFDIDGDANDNTLKGTNVTDRINGLDGNDLLNGGKGDDQLFGGDGDDTYLLNSGDGKDLIVDGNGANKIVFGEDVDKASLAFEQYRADDGFLYLKVSYGAGGDYVTIRNGIDGVINSFEFFSDTSSYTLKDLIGSTHLPLNISGSEISDVMYGSAGDDALHGQGGNDTLYGQDGNDELQGDSGDDYIYGEGGNDFLNGGQGNDTLEGGNGVDTYAINFAMDQDQAIEIPSLGEGSFLSLGNGLSVTDLEFISKSNDLEVRIIGTADSLLIKNYYSNPSDWKLIDSLGGTHNVADLAISTSVIDNADELEAYYTKVVSANYKNHLIQNGYQLSSNGAFEQSVYQENSEYSTTKTRTSLQFLVKNYFSNSDENIYLSSSGEYQETYTYTEKLIQQSSITGANGSSSFARPGSPTAQGFFIPNSALDSEAQPHSSVQDGGFIIRTQNGIWVLNPSWSFPNNNPGTNHYSPPLQRTIYQEEYSIHATRYLDAFSFGEGDNLFRLSNSTMSTIDLGDGNDILTGAYDYTGLETDLSNDLGSYYLLNRLQGADFYRGNQFVQSYIGYQSYTIEDQEAWFGLYYDGLTGFDNYFNNYLPIKYNSINGIYVNGNDGDDTIFGTYNNDIIVGGDGDDYLDGGQGADHYYFFAADNGVDRINDSDAISKLPLNFESNINVYEAYFYGFKNRILSPDLKLRYERESLPDMPVLNATDYNQLTELYEHGVIPVDTVHFGPGISLNDLILSWADRALKIEWGVNKGVVIDLPVDNGEEANLSLGGYDYTKGLGLGIEKFIFADGTEINMGEMLDLVGTPMPDASPLEFELGMGVKTNLGTWANKVTFDAGITSEDIVFSYANSQVVIEHKNGIDKIVLETSFPDISEFDPDNYNYPDLHNVFTLSFSGMLSIEVNELFLYQAFHSLNIMQSVSNLEIDSDVYHFVTTSNGSDTIFIKQGSYDGLILNAGAGDDVIQSTSSSTTYILGGDGNDTINSGLASDYISGDAGDDTLIGGDGDDYLDGGSGYDDLRGGNGNDQLHGGDDEDFLFGGAGDDYLDGGSGADSMSGGLGNDTSIVDDENDYLSGETASGGLDTVISSAISYYGLADAPYIEALRLVGDAIEGSGNYGINLLVGNANDNILGGYDGTEFRESAGNDILQGMQGNDTFNDELDDNLFDGGSGDDVVNAGSGNDLIIGGLDNDTITTGTGYDVIMFNKGDGSDIVNASAGTDNTISLGGDIAYSDLSLSKSANDLILKVGSSDQIIFKDWYSTSANNKSVLNMQVIAEAMQDFNQGGSDVLRDNKIETFNFANLVTAFDTAGTTANWQLTDARLSAHLSSGSDTSAIGGDIAYQYGKNGVLTDVGFLAAQNVLSGSSVGQSAQTLNDASSWSAEVIKLA